MNEIAVIPVSQLCDIIEKAIRIASQDKSGPEKAWTVKECAEHLQVHPSTVYRMAANKQIPFFPVGTEKRFWPSEIRKWQGTTETVDLLAEFKSRKKKKS